ncbi:MAG: C40 family peptidase [Gemmatimonadaceae bacterium]
MPNALSLPERAAAALGTNELGNALIVGAAVAPILDEPRVTSPQIAQVVSGHAVAALDRDGNWWRVRGGDGYEGWIHAGYLRAASALGLDRSWPESATISLGSRVRGPYGERDLPLGALILPEESVVDGETAAAAELATLFPPTAAAVVTTARARFSGASYQWGGITPWGCDCSGFVQTLFALHGVALPRDAWQQALHGEDAGADPLVVAAGALHFFSDRPDGRITHVGLAAGEGELLHVSLGRGGFAVDQIDADDPFVARLRAQWRVARRVLPTV